MIRLSSVLESQKIDKSAIEKYHINGEILMESAGALSSSKLQELYLKKALEEQPGVSIFCGPGNNGGDGLVLARHLYSCGYKNLRIFLLKSKGSSLFELQLKRAKKQGLEILDFNYKKNKFSFFKKKIEFSFLKSSLIVDALFGIGFKGEMKDSFLISLIKKINQSRKRVVSLDTPSGLDADTGVIKGESILAHHTFTFGCAKPGFFVESGPGQVGQIYILNPGFPLEEVKQIAKSYFLVTKPWVKKKLPQRKRSSHKYDHGLLLALTGSAHQWGAGILVGSSAYRIGAGLVFWASHEEPLKNLREVPEIQTLSVRDVFENKGFENRFWKSKRTKALVVGPGLGVGEKTADVILRLKKKIGKNSSFQVVLDADAIRVCSKFHLFPIPSHWVLTPHLTELGEILKQNELNQKKHHNGKRNPLKSQHLGKKEIDIKNVSQNRFSSALKASQISGGILLLKGHHSVIASREKCFIIPTGNASLAKAGSGDVLSGMIGGLMAQGVESFEAVAIASYFHGLIADEWVKKNCQSLSLNPSDLKEYFSSALKKFLILKKNK